MENGGTIILMAGVTVKAMMTGNNAREIVMAFIGALNNQDYATARTYVTDDMSFEGVLGSRDSADAYFHDMEHMKLKYFVKKVFADADDVCLFYQIIMSGATIFGCGWYKVREGKILSIKVIFDPRPILEMSPEQ